MLLSTASHRANRHWSNDECTMLDPDRDVGDMASPRPDGGVVT
ncbi:MAG: hypothetical protein ABIW03_03120 [Sphingomicrobium sp.]